MCYYFLKGSEMSSDDRSWLMRTVMSMDQAATVPYFYPRLFALVRVHRFVQLFKGSIKRSICGEK